MLFGRRKPGYTTTVDSSVDPEQAVLDLQKAELAAKKKPKAEVFDINAASETARRLKETGSSFDGSAAKTGEDVIAAVERETAATCTNAPSVTLIRKILENAFTIGLVISLANPQRAKQQVTNINGST